MVASIRSMPSATSALNIDPASLAACAHAGAASHRDVLKTGQADIQSM
jgi:hypothetical protein